MRWPLKRKKTSETPVAEPENEHQENLSSQEEQIDEELDKNNEDQEASELPSEEPVVEGPLIQNSGIKRPISDIKADIVAQMKTIFDPEIPVNIYELGLIYNVEVDETGKTEVLMTLTAPACPAAEILPKEVEDKSKMVEGVTDFHLELTFEPPWKWR